MILPGTVYDSVYYTPGDNSLGFGIYHPGWYTVGVVYTVPPVK